MRNNYYRILQVDPEAEPEIIEAAYRRLVRMYHPDLNNSADATTRMQDINAAYDILGDPTRRAQYDREFHQGSSTRTRTDHGSARTGASQTAGGDRRTRAQDSGAPGAESRLHFTFMIVSSYARRALHVNHSSLSDGALLFLWTPQGKYNQLWRFEPLRGSDHGYCCIRSVNSGKCLEVLGESTADGTPIVQSTYIGKDHQKWRLIDMGGSFVIEARHSGKVLDAPRNFHSALPVLQWTRHDGDNQRWLLIKP